MKNDSPCMKAPLKGELLRRITQRYPELDLGGISVISHIQSIARSHSAQMSQNLAAYGLTEGKFYVLAYLFSEELFGHENPGPSDIADNLGVTRGTITGLLDGLERDDFVDRCHNSRDRRALTIQMTEKARQFLDGFLRTSTQASAQMVPLDEAEKRTLTEYLTRIELAMQSLPFSTDEA